MIEECSLIFLKVVAGQDGELDPRQPSDLPAPAAYTSQVSIKVQCRYSFFKPILYEYDIYRYLAFFAIFDIDIMTRFLLWRHHSSQSPGFKKSKKAQSSRQIAKLDCKSKVREQSGRKNGFCGRYIN